MRGKKCRNQKKLLLLIGAGLLFNSCQTIPDVIYKLPELPVSPIIPSLTWEDIPGYFGINEEDFDDLQDFFDQYEGYQEKIENIILAYENNEE